jgi:hypothetical protein
LQADKYRVKESFLAPPNGFALILCGAQYTIGVMNRSLFFEGCGGAVVDNDVINKSAAN